MSSPTFQAVGTGAGGTGAVSPAWPTHLTDDIALLLVESANEAISLSDAQGFAEVTNSPQGTGTAGGARATRLAVFWARATSASMAAPTVADPGDHVYARIFTFRGVQNTGDPWDITAGDVQTSISETAVIWPAVTTDAGDCLIALCIAHDIDSTSGQVGDVTNANFTSITEQGDDGTDASSGGGLALITGVKATAGSTGTSTATLAAGSVQGRLTVALMPPDNAAVSLTLGAVTSTATGTVDVVGTSAVTLGAATSTATATVDVFGTLTKTLDTATISSTGTVDIFGIVTPTLGAVTLTATGTVDVVGTSAVTLGAATSVATGTVDVVGTSAVTLGAATSVATGTVDVVGTLTTTLDDVTLLVTTEVLRTYRRRKAEALTSIGPEAEWANQIFDSLGIRFRY